MIETFVLSTFLAVHPPKQPPKVDEYHGVPTSLQANPLPKALQSPLKAEIEKIEEIPSPAPKPVVAPQNSSNTYPMYQCTWYAKSRRPDIPNHLGNANKWFYVLKSMGWSVGFEPRAGAIGQSKFGVHVVYIEKVQGDQVYISERNYDYKGSYNERWADASSFLYIY